MKKPYIKKFADIPPFTVWIVDGQHIRKNIDEEFTNFGQHFDFKFIPKNEFWIDRAASSGEEKYFIDAMLTMEKMLFAGKTIAEAAAAADRTERRERRKSELFKQVFSEKKHKKEIIDKIHKKFLRAYSGAIKVWVVDGELVRDLFFLDFTEGGHDKVYSFIPSGEVWIDDDVLPRERKFVLLHELHERWRMSQGWGYNKAHFESSRLEYFCRHHPRELDKKLKIEVRRNLSAH